MITDDAFTVNSNTVNLTVQQMTYNDSNKVAPIAKGGWLSMEQPIPESIYDYRFRWGSNGGGGMSGSVVLYTDDSDLALGLKCGQNGHCVRMTRPLLHFCLNNPYLTDYEE